jgi:catechol 2,3-dioxygenase-like lactoylglutathione lyase family enzyme
MRKGTSPIDLGGTFTRRALFRHAATLVAGAAAAPMLRAQSPARFAWRPLIDHVQINSDNVPKSTEFYTKVLGLQLLRSGPGNDPNCCADEQAFFGVGDRLVLAVRKHAGRNIDHYGMIIDGFTEAAMTEHMKKHGSPVAKHWYGGYYHADPDGVLVQLRGEDGPAGPKPPAPPFAGHTMRFQWAPLVDHIQLNSANVRKSTEFYQKALGLDLLRVGPPNDRNCCPDEQAFFGVGKRLVLAVRKAQPVGIDHYALLMTNYNKEAVTKELAARGAKTETDANGAWHVVDPDGVKIQIMGAPGPS